MQLPAGMRPYDRLREVSPGVYEIAPSRYYLGAREVTREEFDADWRRRHGEAPLENEPNEENPVLDHREA